MKLPWKQKLPRHELVKLVERLRAVDGTEAELDTIVFTLEYNIPHPRLLEVLCSPDKTPEEALDEAFSHQPIILPPPDTST